MTPESRNSVAERKFIASQRLAEHMFPLQQIVAE
jgi:hypothetical protein